MTTEKDIKEFREAFNKFVETLDPTETAHIGIANNFVEVKTETFTPKKINLIIDVKKPFRVIEISVTHQVRKTDKDIWNKE